MTETLGRFLRQSLPTLLAIGAFAVALYRPAWRTIGLGLGLIFLLVALRRRRQPAPPAGRP